MEFFTTKERIKDLIEELESWLDSPWRHRSRSKNGCDCIGFVYSVYRNLKVVDEDIFFPEYQRDWHIHRKQELMYNKIRESKWFKEIEPKDCKTGDVILFKYGKSAAHIGILVGNQVYHNPTNLYVIKSPIEEGLYKDNITYAFRPIEV